MSWNDLRSEQRDPEQIEAAKRNAEAMHTARQEACAHACRDKTFRQFLRGVALGRSYVNGRSPEAVAYAEGYRALALEILSTAKVINDE